MNILILMLAWQALADLIIASWEENVYLIYNSASGDTHLVSGVTKSFINVILSRQPFDLDCLRNICQDVLFVHCGESDEIILDIVNNLVIKELIEPV